MLINKVQEATQTQNFSGRLYKPKQHNLNANPKSKLYTSPLNELSLKYRVQKIIKRFYNKPNGFQAELQDELTKFDVSKLN